MSDSIEDLIDCGELDIFRIAPDWASQPATEFDFGREVMQYDDGATAYRFLTDDLGWKISMDFTNASKADEMALLSFFTGQKGRLNKFWLPVPWQYYTLAAATSSTTYSNIVYLDPATVLFHNYERFYMLLKDGSFITRRIPQSVSTVFGPGSFQIATGMDRVIQPADVALFGKLALVRFDQDELEMTHETTEVSTCTLTFRELAKEYAL